MWGHASGAGPWGSRRVGSRVFVLSAMASGADLSSLLTASKNLTSHLSRPDLPSVQLSLDQIEAQSRRLVSRLPPGDTDRAYVPLLLPFFSDSSKKQLSTCPGSRRCPCSLQLNSPSEHLIHLHPLTASSRHRCRWLSSPCTRTEPHINHRRGQERNARRLLQDARGPRPSRLGSQETSRL
jgi:hypothetical protein